MTPDDEAKLDEIRKRHAKIEASDDPAVGSKSHADRAFLLRQLDARDKMIERMKQYVEAWVENDEEAAAILAELDGGKNG